MRRNNFFGRARATLALVSALALTQDAVCAAPALTGAKAVRSSPTKVVGSNPTSLKFDFGPGEVKAGYRQVLPTTLYTKELGYGFETETSVAM